MTEARIDIFCLIAGAENPSVSVGTTNPRMPSSVCAQTTATSAMEPLVIHILLPSRTQSVPSCLARVRMPAGLEPKSDSVRPKQPIFSPLAISGSHCSFCSSDPWAWIANIARLPCTDISDLIPESPASTSRQARP